MPSVSTLLPTFLSRPTDASPVISLDTSNSGKGDGEGVSVKAKTQQLSIVGNKEKMMEAHMDMNQCKACFYFLLGVHRDNR
jgi:hypothetical protein